VKKECKKFFAGDQDGKYTDENYRKVAELVRI
jgi:hypothetical protein